jgi:CRP-like cAMP-binding protein
VVNSLLDSLPPDEASLILPELELVPLELKQVLFEQGEVISHAYFPVSGMISLLTITKGSSIETATIGSEGVAGLPVFLGRKTSDSRCSVQAEGEAWRIASEAFLLLASRNREFNASLNRYTAARLAAAYQLAVCNLLHPLSKRCARSLLAIDDRVIGDRFPLTHEYLAKMLGVRRASVSVALGVLQHRQIITSRRGVITLLNRGGLEAEACECEAVIRSRYSSIW